MEYLVIIFGKSRFSSKELLVISLHPGSLVEWRVLNQDAQNVMLSWSLLGKIYPNSRKTCQIRARSMPFSNFFICKASKWKFLYPPMVGEWIPFIPATSKTQLAGFCWWWTILWIQYEKSSYYRSIPGITVPRQYTDVYVYVYIYI